jgi:hypothetical protein
VIKNILRGRASKISPVDFFIAFLGVSRSREIKKAIKKEHKTIKKNPAQMKYLKYVRTLVVFSLFFLSPLVRVGSSCAAYGLRLRLSAVSAVCSP